ncbi:GreA/GreB family elongation factor [Hydrogenophaga sp.]|jgi:regulator of nucleoside diphosphate kinase|uniref:GreA/GreB family elongation factor n=1 Tax=Hydrogenophaga sp. TaxID=1904254 RepID=UPI0035626EAE
MNPSPVERVLTELDHTRLSKLAHPHSQTPVPDPVLEPLQDLLTDARIVPSREVRADIVTMYSQILAELPGNTTPSKLVLCYPSDAEPANGFISVLSPMGLALLGLPKGQTAHWQSPTGQPMSARVRELLFQPEASGDYLS